MTVAAMRQNGRLTFQKKKLDLIGQNISAQPFGYLQLAWLALSHAPNFYTYLEIGPVKLIGL